MIEYRDTVEGVEAGQLAGFFEGWPEHPDVQPFYEALGFARSVGGSLRRYGHQAGLPPAGRGGSQ